MKKTNANKTKHKTSAKSKDRDLTCLSLTELTRTFCLEIRTTSGAALSNFLSYKLTQLVTSLKKAFDRYPSLSPSFLKSTELT